MELIAVTDPEEVEHSKRILGYFRRASAVPAYLAPLIIPLPNSGLAKDDGRSPHHDVSSYAYSQLTVASSCIAALEQMIVRESDDTIHFTASAFGAYALLRNAMDSAAIALWLLEPVNSTLRIKRRILLGLNEEHNKAGFFQSMSKPSQQKTQKRRARLKEVALEAGLGAWNPFKEDLPSMTKTLKRLEYRHTHVIMPWLAVWQLSSGHAHGKMWAHLASNEIEEIPGTKTATGAQYSMTINFGMLAVVMYEAIQLLEAAGERYAELAQ